MMQTVYKCFNCGSLITMTCTSDYPRCPHCDNELKEDKQNIVNPFYLPEWKTPIVWSLN